MAHELYVLNRFRARESRWQLSDREFKDILEKISKARAEAGAKQIASFATLSSEWRHVSVDVFPSYEAYEKYWQKVIAVSGVNTQQFWETEVTLGFAQ